jgi:integrase
MLDAALTRDPELALFCRLAAVTGARRGELTALRWRSIDFTRSALVIREATKTDADNAVSVGDTKTHQARVVALDARSRELLVQHRKRCEEWAAAARSRLVAGAFVFASEVDGSAHLPPNVWTKRFGRLRDSVGAYGVRLHDLRHYCGTEAAEAGIPLPVVMQRLGHSRLSTTQRYAHGRKATDQLAAVSVAATLEDPGASPRPRAS